MISRNLFRIDDCVTVLPKSTDIVIPGSNSTTDVQARIGAGESIHIIKGSKGVTYSFACFA